MIDRKVSALKQAQRELKQQVELARLLEALARAANEADTLAEALASCLERICEHGEWQLGHAAVFKEGLGLGEQALSLLKVQDRERYSACIELIEQYDYSKGTGGFAKKSAATGVPVWIEDMARMRVGPRLSRLAACGIRRAFAFPVQAHGETLALLEFFAVDARSADELLIANIASVAAQLARLIEGERALVRLRASEARVRAIFDNEPECVKVIRADGSLIDMNRSGLMALEAHDVEQVRAHGLINFVLPDYRELFCDFVRRSLNGDACTLEFEIEGMKGTRRWMSSHATLFRLPDERETALLIITRDITAERMAQEKADYLSHHDALTGLPNRGLFQDRLERSLAQARRRSEVLGVLMLNLDRFGKVNESLGAGAGDELLSAVARRMEQLLRKSDTIARFGGNDFAVLLDGITANDEVTRVAEKLHQSYEAPFMVSGQEVFVSASIGVAVFPNGASDPLVVLQHAETAMRELKKEGGNGLQLFDDGRKRESVQHVDLERRLRHALDNGELDLHYQPKVAITSGAIVGAEVLARWNHPELGMVRPAHFIPLAEETGLILPIGEWVLMSACRDARSWQDAGFDLTLAVNLSPRQFRHKNLLGLVTEALNASCVEPRKLELEITETVALSRPEQAASLLARLRDFGVGVALDDFGTGYSSLSHLRRLPLSAVKIDRSFVSDVAVNTQDRAIVAGVTTLAHTLGMCITAEGVEDGVQLEAIRQCGCDDYQGYHFARPVPAVEFRELLERERVRLKGALRSRPAAQPTA